MFDLYYLVNQGGALDGDKTFKGTFGSLALAQAQAAADSIVHFSVESILEGDAVESIVYII